MTNCPICKAEVTAKYGASPYWICPNCDCWFQWPQPPKTYLAEFEGDPMQMSDRDREINKDLAGWLFHEVMKDNPGITLDIGAKLPVLAAELAELNCVASAVEATAKPQLGKVIGYQYDFERDQSPDIKHDLVTLIHTFEHLYDPLRAIRRLRLMVRDSGRLFLRLPQHDVAGFERDLSDGHYSIHPFYHSLSSILEILKHTEHCFVVERYDPLIGSGQADFVLRPISKAPTLCVGIIAKNEERDLPKCIKSLDGVADDIVVVDTGSTDKTIHVAQELACRIAQYFGASSQDDKGDWKLENFSTARNEAISLAEMSGSDWYMWMDADDVLSTPANLHRHLWRDDFDAFSCWIKSAGATWIHHRMWKTTAKVRFKGRCHEYAKLDGLRIGHMDNVLVTHDITPSHGTGQEDSNARNLRMLTLEWAEDPSPRCAFYLANTHKDASRWKEAVEWYTKRIEFGEGFRDEYLFAFLYKSRCEHALLDYREALYTLNNAIMMAPDWAEFYMEMARVCYSQKQYPEAIYEATRALGLHVTPTVLWREPTMYRDQPARLISWCHEHMRNTHQAIAWAELAANMIGGPDREWEARTARLRASLSPRIKIAKQKVIALNRPGAIGDIIMTANLIPALKAANPDYQVWYFCDPFLAQDDQLGWLLRVAGCDQVLDCNAFGQWAETVERPLPLVGYPLAEGYPNKPMQLHLLDYFADEMNLELRTGTTSSGLPSLTLPLPPVPKRPIFLANSPYATIQKEAGWSKYKQWFPERWAKVIEACAKIGIELWPIGKGEGLTLQQSIAAFANARMHIGIDSFCNHLTNYTWDGRKVPGVILWGSTQASAAGYPHNVNISKGIACQPCFREDPKISRMPRGPCINPPRDFYEDDTPHACMANISVDEVVEAVRTKWKELQ